MTSQNPEAGITTAPKTEMTSNNQPIKAGIARFNVLSIHIHNAPNKMIIKPKEMNHHIVFNCMQTRLLMQAA